MLIYSAMTRVAVTRNNNENALSLLRRFNKLVQGARIIKVAKNTRYQSRPKSEYARRKSALKRISRHQQLEKMKRLGLIKDVFYKSPRQA